jgi:hypothetical protein
VVEIIFQFLDFESLFKAGRVCRYWRRIIEERNLWKLHMEKVMQLFEADYENLNQILQKGGKNNSKLQKGYSVTRGWGWGGGWGQFLFGKSIVVK